MTALLCVFCVLYRASTAEAARLGRRRPYGRRTGDCRRC